MGIAEIILIGLSLSMDAFAVSVSNGMVYQNLSRKRMLAMPVAFGLFQGIMPICGFFLGNLFAEWITRYAGMIALLVLGWIGVNMIRESLKEEEQKSISADLDFRTLLFQAVATSIDAFAVGVSFCAIGVNIFSSAGIIALTTFLCSLVAVLVGKKLGKLLGQKAEILGGLILIIIGIKSCFFS